MYHFISYTILRGLKHAEMMKTPTDIYGVNVCFI